MVLKLKLSKINYFFKKLFPILVWLPRYNLHKLKGDVIAGITVGIMVIPQSIAFANLAELPAEYGLYAAIAPPLVYCVTGTSRQVSIGPAATMALFTASLNTSQHPVGAAFLALLVGAVLIVLGILRLGFLTKFIPCHVISAFVSATAITVLVMQLPVLFGLSKPPPGFIKRCRHFFSNIKNTNKWDITLGLACISYLVLFMVWAKRKPSSRPAKNTLLRAIVAMVKWFLCVARNAILCCLATLFVFGFHMYGISNKFTIIGHLPKGLPAVQIPIRTVTLPSNRTIYPEELIKNYGASLLVLPLILFIQSLSIAKAFARDYKIDPTQEMIALGFSNVIGSFFGGWLVTGSFSRSAVNAMSGAQTPLAGVFSSMIVFLAVQFLTPVFYYIPSAALAAIIFTAMITLIDVRIATQIWLINKVDMFPLAVAFLGSFYRLDVGVLAGTGVTILILVYKEAKPIYEMRRENKVATFLLKDALTFPGVDYLNQQIFSFLEDNKNVEVVQIDVSTMLRLDFPTLVQLRKMRAEIPITLKFVNIPLAVVEKFTAEGLDDHSIISIDNEENEQR